MTYKNAIVWSQVGCIACNSAKQLLTSRGYMIDERIIGEGGPYTKKDLILQVPHARSVPHIFINGEYVGDFRNLREWLKDNDNT